MRLRVGIGSVVCVEVLELWNCLVVAQELRQILRVEDGSGLHLKLRIEYRARRGIEVHRGEVLDPVRLSRTHAHGIRDLMRLLVKGWRGHYGYIHVPLSAIGLI